MEGTDNGSRHCYENWNNITIGINKSQNERELEEEIKRDNKRMGYLNIDLLTGKETELAEEMENIQIQALGLSETKKKVKEGYS